MIFDAARKRRERRFHGFVGDGVAKKELMSIPHPK